MRTHRTATSILLAASGPTYPLPFLEASVDKSLPVGLGDEQRLTQVLLRSPGTLNRDYRWAGLAVAQNQGLTGHEMRMLQVLTVRLEPECPRRMLSASGSARWP